MARLIINPETPSAWEFPLAPGVNRLGRGPENDLILDHASVSSQHCELRVEGAGAVLRDVGSVSGSFVNGELVEQANLASTQRFKLGEVELEFIEETAAPGTAAPPPTSAPQAPPTREAPTPVATGLRPGRCRHHPRELARWTCPKCGRGFCDLCVSTRSGGQSTNRFCRVCGVECAVAVVPPEAMVMPLTFREGTMAAFSYPFRGDGPMLLATGTVFFLLLRLPQLFSGTELIVGAGAVLILGVFGTGYLFNFAKTIVTSTVEDRSDLPDWPEFTDWIQDVCVPLGQLLGLLAFCFGPSVVLRFWHPDSDSLTAVLRGGALAVGAFLAPMAVLAVAMFDSAGALGPLFLIGSIRRTFRPYLVAVAIFGVVVGTEFGLVPLVEVFLPIPLLPALLGQFLSLYLLTVGMRVLGLFYRAHQDRLRWFKVRDH